MGLWFCADAPAEWPAERRLVYEAIARCGLSHAVRRGADPAPLPPVPLPCTFPVAVLPPQADVLGVLFPLASNGTRCVVVPLAGVPDPFPPELAAQWRVVGRAAAAQQVTVAIDAAAEAKDMQRLMEAVDDPAVRLFFSTGGHRLRRPWGTVETALQRIAGWLGCLELSDADIDRQPPGLVPLGEGGTIDWARALQIVRNVRYAGPVVIVPGVRARRRGATVAEWEESLRAAIRRLQHCGWFDPV